MYEFRADDVQPAGDHLLEELTARGWTQAEFAGILGRPVQFLSEIINGKKEITRESAAQIGAALGMSRSTGSSGRTGITWLFKPLTPRLQRDWRPCAGVFTSGSRFPFRSSPGGGSSTQATRNNRSATFFGSTGFLRWISVKCSHWQLDARMSLNP
ncbi:hypothetical protein CTI14_05635 [Methylobacterium radiotolerans]|nr:hypothetical protein CTI14_05635 [Methylobacterium radiotolerans]